MTDSHEPQAWLAVHTTYNTAEAHIVAGRLQNAGFHPRVHQEPGGSALGITVGILGEVQVLVHENEFDAAQSLLSQGVEAYDEDAYEDDEAFDLDNDGSE